MIRIIAKIIGLMLIIGVGYSAQVKKIHFESAKPSVRLHFRNSPGNQFDPSAFSADSLLVAEHFQKRGWLDCEVSVSIDSTDSGIRITYKVVKHQPYVLKIKLNQNVPDSGLISPLISIFEHYNAHVADENTINLAINDILDLMASYGYPYAETRIASLLKNASQGILSLAFDLNHGPIVSINRVVFDGTRNLRPDFLKNYSGLNLPFRYDKTLIDRAVKRLNNAEFLDMQNSTELRYDQYPENGVLIIPINEVPALTIDGALGMSSENNDFFGKLKLKLANLFGSGRQGAIDWSKKDKHSSKISFNYSEPYPFGYPVQADFALYQIDRDSLYIETGGSLSLTLSISDIYSFSVAAGASGVTPETYGAGRIAEKDKLFLEAGVIANTLDFNKNPSTGEYFAVKVKSARETIHQDSLFSATEQNFRSFELTAEKYLALTSTSIVAFALKTAGDFDQDVSSDRQVPLGGFGSLRGYFQDQFYVTRYILGTLEYRLLTSRTSRAYIFNDMAFFKIDSDFSGDLENVHKTSTGIGLTTTVRSGSASLELAVPHDKGFSETKLHIGFKGGF